MICSTCNTKGFICKTKIIDLGIDIFMCGKCETCWVRNENKTLKVFGNITMLLKEYNFKYGEAEIEEIKIICSMCENNGEIYKAKIANLGIDLKICNKCNACWTKDQPITIKANETLKTFLEKNGLKLSDVKIDEPIILCPRCDGQGEVHKSKIVNLGIILKICDECEACWSENQKITTKTFKDLSTFLEEHGLEYENIKIEQF